MPTCLGSLLTCFGGCVYVEKHEPQEDNSRSLKVCNATVGAAFGTARSGRPTILLSDAQFQRFGGQQPALLLVPHSSMGGLEQDLQSYAASGHVPHVHCYVNGPASALLSGNGYMMSLSVPDTAAAMRVLQEREPILATELISQLTQWAKSLASNRSDPGSYSFYFDSEAYSQNIASGSGGLARAWSYVVAQPCFVQAAEGESLDQTCCQSQQLQQSLSAKQPRPGLGPQPRNQGSTSAAQVDASKKSDLLAALLVKFTLSGDGLAPHHEQQGAQAPVLHLAKHPHPTSSTGGYLRPSRPPILSEDVVLSGLACSVTAISISNGSVLYQNDASRLFWGDMAAEHDMSTTITTQPASSGRRSFHLHAASVLAATAAAGPAVANPHQQPSMDAIAASAAGRTAAAVTATHTASAAIAIAAATANTPPGRNSISQPGSARSFNTLCGMGLQGPQGAGMSSCSTLPATAAATAAAAAGGVQLPYASQAQTMLGNASSLLNQALQTNTTVGTSQRVSVADGACVAAGGGGGGPAGVLQQLFAFEPFKYERMVQETCIEGRPWKGIIRMVAPAGLLLMQSALGPHMQTHPHAHPHDLPVGTPSAHMNSLPPSSVGLLSNIFRGQSRHCSAATATATASAATAAAAVGGDSGLPSPSQHQQHQYQHHQQQQQPLSAAPWAIPSGRRHLHAGGSLPPHFWSLGGASCSHQQSLHEPGSIDRSSALLAMAVEEAAAAGARATRRSGGVASGTRTAGGSPFETAATAAAAAAAAAACGGAAGGGTGREVASTASTLPSGFPVGRKGSILLLDADPFATSVWGLLSQPTMSSSGIVSGAVGGGSGTASVTGMTAAAAAAAVSAGKAMAAATTAAATTADATNMALFAAESSGPMAPHELSLSSSPAGAAYAAAALRDPFTRRSDTSRGGSQLHLGGGGGGGGSHREPFTLGGSLVRQFEGPLGRQLLAPEAPTPRLSQPLQHSPPQQPLSAEHSRQAVTAVQSGAPGGQQEQQGQGQQRQVQGQSQQQQQQLNQQQQRSTGTWALSAAATVARHRASLRGRSLLRHSSIERTDSVSPRSTTTAQHNSSHQHHRSFAEIFRTLAFPRGSDVAPPAGRTRSSGNVSLGLGMLGTWVGSHTGRNLTGTPTSQHGSHTSHANSPGHSPSHHNPHHPQHHSSRLYARLYAHHHHNKHNQQPAHNQHNSHGPNHLRSGHQASADVEDSVDDVGSVRSAVGGVYASEKGSRSYTAARSNRSFVVPTPRIPSSPALPRVVAFASSLRHAPPPVQQLQQQMSLKRTSSRTSRVDSSHLDSRQLDSPTYIINMAMGAVVVGGGAGGGGQQGSRPDSAIASPTFTERQSGAVASGAMGTVVVTDERALQPSGGCAGPYMPMSRNSAGSGAVLPLSRQQLTSPAAGGGGGFQGSAPAVACGNAAGAADLRDAFLGAGAGQRLSVSGPAAAVASVATATGSDVVLSVAAGGQGEAEGSKAASTGVGGASDATVEVEAEEEVEGEGELEVECWQEVTATRTVDTATGQAVLLLTQVDVTAKVLAERHIARVSETEHRLLEEIFPRHVLAYMTEEGGPWAGHGGGSLHHRTAGWRPVVRDINKLATSHDEVTLLFADIQGFTPMCKILEPRVVMTFLNDLFTRFDRRLDEFGVYKVETIGDCYFVVGGLVQEDEDGMLTVREGGGRGDRQHAERVFMFAKAMLLAASQVTLPTTGCPVRMRIGIHSGPVVSGVVGQRMPRFCLFGDAVNTASRMESTGVAGCIHASDASWRLLSNEAWVPTGGIEVKGRGLMQTYLWAPPYADLPPESQAILQKCMQAATASGATMTSSAAATTSGAATNIAAGATAQQPMQRQGSRQEQGQQQQQRGRQAGWVDSVAACSQNGQDQVLLRNRSLVSTAAAAAAAAAASSTVASSIASCVGGGDGRSHGAAAAATAATATAVARMTAPATATSGSNVQDAAVDSCNTLAALLL